MSTSHEALVATLFGSRARGCGESVDHAAGADLQRLTAIVSGRPGGRVLDLGCGGGHVSFAVAPHAKEVVAYDLSSDRLAAVRDEARARGLDAIRTQQGVAAMMPFADAHFDFVFTRFSAHHWAELGAGLGEMRRVVKPGGLAVAIDTISPGIPLHDSFLHAIELLRDRSHMRNYTVEEWDDAMRAAGFLPAAPTLSRLRLDFAAWIQRSGTRDVETRAVRALQRQMPSGVAEHFALEPDGSFTLDTMTIEAEI